VRRRLDRELVRRGLARSRADALAAVADGRVVVHGSIASNPARLVGDDEPVHVTGPAPRYVSRGGVKLEAALDRFAIDPADQRWLDAGASTGGFTDCLLQRGAREVVAVDVGHGQLAWSLRADPRVQVLEQRNVRTLDAATIGGPVDATCADLSFISLRTVAPALLACTVADGTFVLLVKPQFEAGRARVGKGGVIRDPGVHEAVLAEVVAGLLDAGLGVVDLMASPITGADGNREFLGHARAGAPPVTDDRIAAVARTTAPVPGQNGG
jgi:23S rRNA (cytidine1920-2'-O)/16S rRNA (cytidine1409-2'-O)-methyltransferase